MHMSYMHCSILTPGYYLLPDDHVAFFQAFQNLNLILGLNAGLDSHAALAFALAHHHEAAALEGAHGLGRQPKHIILVLEHDSNLDDRHAGLDLLAHEIENL